MPVDEDVSLRMPLLKNLIWNEPWTQVKTTKLQREGAAEDFRGSVMDTVRDIENAYWQLIADEEASQPDIAPFLRGELATIRAAIAGTQSSHRATQLHYHDAIMRIDAILDPS